MITIQLHAVDGRSVSVEPGHIQCYEVVGEETHITHLRQSAIIQHGRRKSEEKLTVKETPEQIVRLMQRAIVSAKEQVNPPGCFFVDNPKGGSRVLLGTEIE